MAANDQDDEQDEATSLEIIETIMGQLRQGKGRQEIIEEWRLGWSEASEEDVERIVDTALASIAMSTAGMAPHKNDN